MPLTRSEKLSLFFKGLIFAQLHPVSLFATFLFTVATGVLYIHFDNIRYDFPFSGWALLVFWTIGYLIFSSFLYTWMICNEIRGYQNKLADLNKSNAYSPSQILDLIARINNLYIPGVIFFWPTLIILITYYSSLDGEAEITLFALVPLLFMVVWTITFVISLNKRTKINEYFGFSLHQK